MRRGLAKAESLFPFSFGLLKDDADALVGFIWRCDKVITECIFLEHRRPIYEVK